MSIENSDFVHHVFFWLKNDNSQDDKTDLITGLKQLSVTPGIKGFQIGIPAGTERGVVENSYGVSWLVVFDNREDHDIYQTHPVHLKFIEECAHLWSKVTVFDTVNV